MMETGRERTAVVNPFATRPLHRAAPVVLLVIVAGAVVAVAAGGTGLFVPASAQAPSWLRVLRIGGAVAAIAGMVGLLIHGRRLIDAGDPDFDSTGSALAAAVTIMSVIALVAWLAPRAGFAKPADPGASGRSGEVGEARSGLSSLPPLPGMTRGAEGPGSRDRRPGSGARLSRRVQPGDPGGAQERTGGSVLSRVGNAILLAVLLLAALIGFRILTSGREEDEPDLLPEEEEEPLVAALDAEAGLLASLDDVAYEGRDPREQITVAYRRLLRALALAGAPRQPQEAPHEYLLRALGPLGVRSGPMHRLAGLYVLAQFSDHPVTERHRASAVEALEAGLDDLRAWNGAGVAAAVTHPADA